MIEEDEIFEQNDEEPIIVECEVTITITRKVKLKVFDADIFEDSDYNDSYTREISFDNVNWEETVEENGLVPKKWNMIGCEVNPISW